MWIGSYRLVKNVYSPDYIKEYIHQHVDDLYQKIKCELSDHYTVVLDKSRQSESCYLTIFKDSEQVRVSFRNHEGMLGSYDCGVYLWKFKTWHECEKYFVKEMLPMILSETIEDNQERR